MPPRRAIVYVESAVCGAKARDTSTARVMVLSGEVMVPVIARVGLSWVGYSKAKAGQWFGLEQMWSGEYCGHKHVTGKDGGGGN